MLATRSATSNSIVLSEARVIRVAHLIHSVAHGGPDTIVINWIRALDKRRYESHVLCFYDSDTGREQQFVESATAAGIRVNPIPWNRRKPFFRAARAVSQFVGVNGIDILHCYNTYSDLTGVLVKCRTGVKIITTIWVWGHPGWKRATMQFAERLALPFFDQVTAQSESARRATVQPGIPLSKVKVLICGYGEQRVELKPEERDRDRAKLGAGSGDFVLINIARFWPEKGHEILLLAFRLVLRKCPAACLWLVGAGPDQEKIRMLAQRLELTERVRFLGFRKDLHHLLALADIQVHASHTEGLPLALCSGMAAGVPIVATRVGGVPEIVSDSRSGILVEPRQPAKLAEAIVDLIANPIRRKQLGAEALRFINEEYSLVQAAERVQAVYEGMVKR